MENTNSEGQKCICQVCHKCFMNMDKLRLHLNTAKNCRPKYSANKEIMEALKNDYQITTGKELFTCFGCGELHSLSTLTQHAETKANGICKKNYEALGLWTILKQNSKQKIEAKFTFYKKKTENRSENRNKIYLLQKKKCRQYLVLN